MAYDEALAERIRDHLDDNPDILEKKMFGGIAFMYRGNMAVGVSKDELMVRVGEEAHEESLDRPGVRIFDLSGKRMRGWILVAPSSIASDARLASWIDTGIAYAGSLPPK